MNVTGLKDIDKPITADLARRVGVSLTPAMSEAECKAQVKARRTDAIIGSQTPMPVQTLISDLNEPKPFTSDRLLHGNDQQGEAASESANLVEFAASVLQHLSDVQKRNRELTGQLTDAMEAHRRDSMELVAAETREMAVMEDLERALRDIEHLQTQLAWSRQFWWNKFWS